MLLISALPLLHVWLRDAWIRLFIEWQVTDIIYISACCGGEGGVFDGGIQQTCEAAAAQGA